MKRGLKKIMLIRYQDDIVQTEFLSASGTGHNTRTATSLQRGLIRPRRVL